MNRRRNFAFLAIALALTGFISPKVEAKKTTSTQNTDPVVSEGMKSLAVIEDFSTVYVEETKIDAMIAAAAKKNEGRAPAQASSPSESLMSSKARELRDRFLNATTGEEIGTLLNEMDANYDSLPTDAKFFAARVLPIQAFEGFTWKMLPIIQQTRMGQELAVGVLRGLMAQMSIRFPGEQNKAVFAYVTQPQKGNATMFTGPFAAYKGQFAASKAGQNNQAERAMQNYLSNVMVGDGKTEGKITKAIRRLEKISLADKPIVMDAKIRFGVDLPQGETNPRRFHFIGEAERFGALSRMHRRMAVLSNLLAYDFNGFIRFRKEIGRALGIDVAGSQILQFSLTGLTREARIEQILKKNHPNLFALRKDRKVKYTGQFKPLSGQDLDIGRVYTIAAYNHLRRSVVYTHAFWSLVGKNNESGGKTRYQQSSAFILDPELFAARDQEISQAIDAMRGLTPSLDTADSIYPLHSLIENGKVVNVDMRSFFFYPPENLQRLLPTQYDPGEPGADKKTAMKQITLDDGTQTAYRDYTQGMATGWDPAAYAKLYPGISGSKQIAENERVLLTSRGGRLVSNVLFSFVR